MKCSYVSRFMSGYKDGDLLIRSDHNMIVGIHSISTTINGKRCKVLPYLSECIHTDNSSAFFMHIPSWRPYNTIKLTASSRKCDTIYIASNSDVEYYMYNGFLFDSNCRMYLMPAIVKQLDEKDKTSANNALIVSDSVFKKVDTKIKGFINKAIYEVSSYRQGNYNVHVVDSSKMTIYVPYGVGYNYGLSSVFENSFINARICDTMYKGHYYIDEIERTFSAKSIDNVNNVIRLHKDD